MKKVLTLFTVLFLVGCGVSEKEQETLCEDYYNMGFYEGVHEGVECCRKYGCDDRRCR